ncbi:SubName: Full=Uncharacterized protein {ECO:0000313/EMBL:CCA69252.1} [Serendipita indica DSM 11827]|uniref:Uncharacterized protein n=1 Tax=Serendipita indica (strain DSM 11827) TaxID=1109443 RepID=G4TD43_SERID|nr:SubName: Full=Uncharacterized protein {ECO:0000313/EMBL:CCA69252.1} [Serendipita indica DSM 11827]CCA69252.1 hypothetical protein PIIN_03151 [Serendipita indica DSM 11827]
MSDDIQMDLEPAQVAVAHPDMSAAQHPTTGFQAPQWPPQSGFALPAHQQTVPQGAETVNGPFAAFIPPAVAASAADQEDARDEEHSDRIPAKMHIRRPGRDNWSYVGRVGVYQELTPKTPIVVVRLQSNDKTIATFSESSNISVDKRGNFIVIASVEPAGVISYSLHAQTNNDALRLLASIELAAYKLGSVSGTENRAQSKLRRKIERTIREDRRKRHKRRKDDDMLVAMLGNASLDVPTV